jgi:hypothetical protein
LSPKEKQVEIDRYKAFLSTTKDGAGDGAPTAGESPDAASSALPAAVNHSLCPLGASALSKPPRPTPSTTAHSHTAGGARGDAPEREIIEQTAPSVVPAGAAQRDDDHADDVPRMPLNSDNGLYDLHRDHVPADDSFVYALVARTVGKAERMSNPRAKAALQSEWDKLRRQGVWDETRVRPWAEVAAEARKEGRTVHVGRIFEICVEKNSELPRF